MTEKLKEKIALITGSDSGIGQATAIEFAKEGADVVITYLHDEKGAQRTLEQVEAHGRRAIVVQADISNEEQVENVFNQAVTAFGTVHILMNNAGVDASGEEVAELPTETWDRAIRVNVYGAFFCCRRFINIRKEAGGGGKIINVTSVHQEIPNAGGRLRLLQRSAGQPHQHACPGARTSWHQREQPWAGDGLDTFQPGRDRQPGRARGASSEHPHEARSKT